MTNDIFEKDNNQRFAFDIQRTIILSKYMNEWGQPEFRKILRTPNKSAIEIYYFPSADIHRFSTVGLSNIIRKNGDVIDSEWMLAIYEKNIDIDRIFSYISDLIAHFIENCIGNLTPRVLGESKLAPNHWTAKGILIDELRGESEELEEIEIGGRKIHVNWIAPLSGAEVQFILVHGIEEFDKRVDHSDQSIIDPTRIRNLID